MDPLDRAESAQPRQSGGPIFGRIAVNGFDGVLTKGVGKEPFDPQVHSEDQRITVLQFSLTPLAGSSMRRPVDREMIAESAEWAKVVLPSIKACGLRVRDINDRYCAVELVPSGRRYTDRSGEEKDATTLKFVKFFADEAAAVAAQDAARHGGHPTSNGVTNGVLPATDAAANQRRTALKFVAAFWKQSAGDPDVFAGLLSKNALTRSLSMSDDDVVAIIAGTPI